MSSSCLYETTGCMAYYTLMPIVFCSTILSGAQKTFTIVRSMSAPATSSYARATPSSPFQAPRAYDSPASTRPPTRAADLALQQQLAEIEVEKAQQRWSLSRPPSYRTYDEREESSPQLPPFNFDRAEKLSDSASYPEKDFKIVVRPRDEKRALDTFSQPQFVEKMSYSPTLDKSGVGTTVYGASPGIGVY